MTEQTHEQEFFGDASLRWYQTATRNAVADALEQQIMRTLIKAPTGSGKTLTIACTLSFSRVRNALGVEKDRKLRVLFASHKHRLLTQAEEEFANQSNVEIIPQSIFSDLPSDLDWDVTVIDEAHHEACASFQYQLEELGNKPIVGMTATDERADGYVIKFERIIEPITREQAVDEGWLAETDLYTFVDAPAKDKTPQIKSIIDNYGDQMGQTMVFMRTKREVRTIAEYLNNNGYSAIALTNQSEDELDNILNRFEQGEIQFVVNCNKINEGVDVKGCTDVVLGRQFGSYPQLNQVIGRAARPDSDCRVWELINPLSGANLDTTVVVGTPRSHKLIYGQQNQWVEREFTYTVAA